MDKLEYNKYAMHNIQKPHFRVCFIVLHCFLFCWGLFAKNIPSITKESTFQFDGNTISSVRLTTSYTDVYVSFSESSKIDVRFVVTVSSWKESQTESQAKRYELVHSQSGRVLLLTGMLKDDNLKEQSNCRLKIYLTIPMETAFSANLKFGHLELPHGLLCKDIRLTNSVLVSGKLSPAEKDQSQLTLNNSDAGCIEISALKVFLNSSSLVTDRVAWCNLFLDKSSLRSKTCYKAILDSKIGSIDIGLLSACTLDAVESFVNIVRTEKDIDISVTHGNLFIRSIASLSNCLFKNNYGHLNLPLEGNVKLKIKADKTLLTSSSINFANPLVVEQLQNGNYYHQDNTSSATGNGISLSIDSHWGGIVLNNRKQ